MLQKLANELHLPYNVPLVIMFCDNKSTISIASSPKVSKKLKHVNIAYHLLKQVVEEGYINMKYVPSKDNMADFLTKPIPHDKHRASCLEVGLLFGVH